jgi:outer membrane protein TolC
VEAARRAADSARAHFEFAHARASAGYGPRLDEVRAAQELAADQAQLENAQVQLVRLRETLGVLLAADHAVDVDQRALLPDAAPVPQALAGMERRSDVRLGRLRLHAAEHVLRDDWADYAPSLTLSAQAFFQDPPTLTVPTTGWQLQLLLSIPLYDGGLRYGLARERRVLVREAELGLEGTLRQAASDVRTADEEVRRALAALAAAREAARLADEGLHLSNLAYQAGAATNIEVLDAERRARDADTAVALAEDAWRQALLDLALADGRLPAPR